MWYIKLLYITFGSSFTWCFGLFSFESPINSSDDILCRVAPLKNMLRTQPSQISNLGLPTEWHHLCITSTHFYNGPGVYEAFINIILAVLEDTSPVVSVDVHKLVQTYKKQYINYIYILFKKSGLFLWWLACFRHGLCLEWNVHYIPPLQLFYNYSI